MPASPWPTHPDGRPKALAEMNAIERHAVDLRAIQDAVRWSDMVAWVATDLPAPRP